MFYNQQLAKQGAQMDFKIKIKFVNNVQSVLCVKYVFFFILLLL